MCLFSLLLGLCLELSLSEIAISPRPFLVLPTFLQGVWAKIPLRSLLFYLGKKELLTGGIFLCLPPTQLHWKLAADSDQEKVGGGRVEEKALLSASLLTHCCFFFKGSK